MPQVSDFLEGLRLLRTVQEALKLGDRAIQRCVIDIPLSGVVKFYVEELATRDMVEALVGELPRVRPDIQWMDRIEVANANGGGTTQVVVRELKTDPEDRENRNIVRELLGKLKRISAEERDHFLDWLFDEESPAAPTSQQAAEANGK